jgi:large repetitive protein
MHDFKQVRHRKSVVSLALGAALLIVGGGAQSASAAGKALPDLVVTIAANPSIVQPGAPVDWVVTARNIGIADATTPVTVDVNYYFAQGKTGSGAGWTCSAVPASRTPFDKCTLPSLAAGASATFTIANTATGYAGTSSLSAVIDQSLTIAESDETNNASTGSYVVPVNAPSDLVPVVIQSYQTTVPILPTEEVTYNIQAKSISTYFGPVQMSITDKLPAGFTFVRYTSVLADGSPGATCTEASGLVTCTGATNGDGNSIGTTYIMITALPPVAAGLVDYTAINTVTVDSANTVAETDETNNTTTTAVPVSNTLPDLQLQMTTEPGPVTAGSVVTHTVTLTNVGPGAAPAAFVDFSRMPNAWISGGGPGVTCVATFSRTQWARCTAAGLAPGASVTFPVKFQAGDFAATITSVATAITVVDALTSSVVREGNYANNSASVSDVVSGPPVPPVPTTPPVTTFADFTTTVTGPATAALNGKPTYTVSVANVGTAAAGPNTFTVYLRGYDRIDSVVAPAGYNCAVRKDHPAGRYVDCSGSGLAVGATATLSVIGAGAYSAGTWPVTSTADSFANVTELSETNNTATFNTVVS